MAGVDELLRDLERRASAGDADAARDLARAAAAERLPVPYFKGLWLAAAAEGERDHWKSGSAREVLGEVVSDWGTPLSLASLETGEKSGFWTVELTVATPEFGRGETVLVDGPGSGTWSGRVVEPPRPFERHGEYRLLMIRQGESRPDAGAMEVLVSAARVRERRTGGAGLVVRDGDPRFAGKYAYVTASGDSVNVYTADAMPRGWADHFNDPNGRYRPDEDDSPEPTPDRFTTTWVRGPRAAVWEAAQDTGRDATYADDGSLIAFGRLHDPDPRTTFRLRFPEFGLGLAPDASPAALEAGFSRIGALRR